MSSINVPFKSVGFTCERSDDSRNMFVLNAPEALGKLKPIYKNVPLQAV